MNLHKNKKTFLEIIKSMTNETGIHESIIEKDYYVTMFLQTLSKKLPNLIFKGGTSLSKCYGVIKRFSEDIDITLEYKDKLTEGQRRSIKQAVVDSAAELGLDILNLESTRSRRDFNRYEIDYPSDFKFEQLKQFVFVETSVSVRSFPSEIKMTKSMIQEFLEEKNLPNIAEQYDLKEFSVRTQRLDRTLIDKLFALGDYYLQDKVAGHSRHVYDIYKLLPLVKIDDSFLKLVKEVREVRKISQYCYSAQEGVDMQKLLTEIADKDICKKDYEEKLQALLYEKVTYTEAKKSLIEIIGKKIFE
ncbi:MAG: nucleotidyl transferase AbiEii/AbiGii toxin family protein [Clostridiales bacterium]|jgi:predicted nucleotidyltransferase component of viral defense system|nr:nucleotidyl transferase AbiEii/AbiGii toxin family protein [Clostridiales bacterium]